MVIQFYNLQYTMYHAENAQAYQNLFLSHDRAVRQASSFQTHDLARAQAFEQVQHTEESAPKRIREEEGRRQPFAEGESAGREELSEETGNSREQGRNRKDPHGRGRCIDIEA